MSKKPVITVIGTGYVGVTTAAILANAGYRVYALDISQDRLQALREGRSFFYEEGLNPLIQNAVKTKNLIPTSSYKESIPKSSFIFSCVGTPDNPDGSSNLTYIFAAAEEAAKYTKSGSIFIQKSTVPVGTGRQVSKIFAGKGVDYVSNPEFLRESTALSDSLFFDRVVAGSDNKEAVEKVLGLYKDMEKSAKSVARLAGIRAKSSKGSYIATALDSAELIKVTANAFLALKISFANSIAKLADKNNADVMEVMDAVGADPRIGRAFLSAGRGYGGGCFPKDVSGLISSALEHGVDMPIMVAATEVNEQMAGYIADKAKAALGGSFKDKKASVLGLSFKAGTSDARKSPGVKLANILQSQGAEVIVYDPQANGEAKDSLNRRVSVAGSVNEAVLQSDAVFIATDWLEFKEIDFDKLAHDMSGDLVVDGMNCLDPTKVEETGLRYIGVGRY
ncbi:MAG TPA: UDP-glucose/GDP-mannose dehydrogenase family protein [Candidatus Saccharimonadales bacterium]|nr:UDP-glucose/GDP-mannose dehydrogenase family protein [Candidatus Saccharimonadales bacterium]